MKHIVFEKKVWLLLAVSSGVTGAAAAQDFSALRINEVIAENDTQLPRDMVGSTTDMVEIFNTGTVPIDLGHPNPAFSLGLSDFEGRGFPSTFKSDTIVPPGGSLVVFCDGNNNQGECEPHTDFRIASDGSEPISLWAPATGVDDRGYPIRELIDQVWLPPLPSDVSFGRFPDGPGPAPVPLADVLGTFVFFPPGQSTFGSCRNSQGCGNGIPQRICNGAPNLPGGNLQPKVTLESSSNVSPEAGEPVRLRVRASDELDPGPPGLAAVEVVFRVDGGAEQVVSLSYDALTGPRHDVFQDIAGSLAENPFRWWTFWDGEIPGQPAGSRVEFFLRARDSLGEEDTAPDTICAAGVGPCDRQFGGPGCELDPGVTTCSTAVPVFRSCKSPWTYSVGFQPQGTLAGLVINEVVSRQFDVLTDLTEAGCAQVRCPFGDCCRQDFIELHNTALETVDLSGLFLSSNPFDPREWEFPPGSEIEAGEYLIVWIDGDGGACPDPELPPVSRPCFWNCPDPTDPSRREYHTNFTLDASGDEIHLFASEKDGFGRIHGVRFEDIGINRTLALLPDGDRLGCWVVSDPSPRGANPGSCPARSFIRADADSNCSLEITDAVFTLLYLFQGGADPLCLDAADADDNGVIEITDAVFGLGFLFQGTGEPPPPGPGSPGRDPTADDLTCLAAVDC